MKLKSIRLLLLLPVLILLLVGCGVGIEDTDYFEETATRVPSATRALAAVPTRNLEPTCCAEPKPTIESNSTLIPVQTIELRLPFRIDHEPEGIMPMGETINHPPPMGHPGIDFQWPYKETEIIVALDGVIGDIVAEVSPYDGDTVYITTVVTGGFGVIYETVDLPKFIPNLQVGDEVVYGMILGYPQAVESGTWRMMHWAFGKVFENEGRRANPEGIIENYHFDYLCPLEYLTESERLRLEQIWDYAHYGHKDEFPNLCNGYYELL
jgi:hypothetical protein